jgi:hypothetical protein
MRFIWMSLLLMVFAPQVHAALALAPELTPEQKALIEFQKGVSNPDKSSRVKAIETFEATKPPSTTWPLFVRIASTDPEAEVRHTAFATLAKMPAHDTSLAKMLVSIFDGLKPNDLKERAAIGKLMGPSEFKADVVGALADQVEKLRWPEDPKGYRGKTVPEKVKDEAKEKKAEFSALVNVLVDVGKCDVTEMNKETPVKVKKWWDANQVKLQKADNELLAKYAKADADAAKAAKDAAMAALSGKHPPPVKDTPAAPQK